MSDCLVICEALHQKLRQSTLAGICFGQQMARKTGGRWSIVLVGHDLAAATELARGYGAAKVYVVDHADYAHYLCETYTHAIAAVQKSSGATLLASTSTSTSKDLMPRLATRLGAAMASDVIQIIDHDTFKRPMWAGNVIATVQITTPIKVCTVRPTEFTGASPGAQSPVERLDVPANLSAAKARFMAVHEVKSERPDVTTAARVVSGGRGVKSAEGFQIIEKLADKLKAGIGASRAVCDSGWVANDLQIGQTGKVVAPDMYVAVGISGAIQHLAGMKGSKVIVAINKDAEAPIFQVADYGLVDDLFVAVPQIIAGL